MTNVIAEHIEISPGVCGGRPRIAGSRIRVQDVAILHEHLGQSPDEIVAAFPSITLADVHAALAFYFDHRDDVRQMIAADDALAANLQKETPSKLAPRRPADDAAVPS